MHTVEAIDMCLFKAFQLNTLVHQHIQKKQQHHNHAYVMMCFTPFYDKIKQDDAKTAAYRKLIIGFLNQLNIMYAKLSTLWGNIDGCDENYRYYTELYLFSISSQASSFMIKYGISAPRHDIKIVDGLNATENRFLFQLMSNVKLTGSKGYET